MTSLKKSQDRGLVFKGGITVFTSLIFILLLSLVGALVESVSIQISRSRKRADTLLALESVFAEYSTDLLEQYELFARFNITSENIENRLSYYGANHMTHTILKREFLTDYQGMPFYHQAVQYMKDLVGLDHVPGESTYNFSPDEEIQIEEQNNQMELENLLEDEGAELPTENNPLKNIYRLKGNPLLPILIPNSITLSEQSISLETLPSKRQLQKGNYAKVEEGGAVDKAFFVAYVMEYFCDITDEKDGKNLFYEIEYLLGGQENDRENLEIVCKKIMNLRTIANYSYLLTDATRKAEADAMALTLCSLVGMPGLQGVLKQALLFAWAYGESIVDVRTLLKGEKVPFVKTGENWQLQLKSLMTLGTAEEEVTEKSTESGFSYQDYLKGLLLLEAKETLSMRCLDLVESNLGVAMDQCVTKIKIKSKANLRRGIEEIFTTSFQYR